VLRRSDAEDLAQARKRRDRGHGRHAVGDVPIGGGDDHEPRSGGGADESDALSGRARHGDESLDGFRRDLSRAHTRELGRDGDVARAREPAEQARDRRLVHAARRGGVCVHDHRAGSAAGRGDQ
jgi:hypothetical protein